MDEVSQVIYDFILREFLPGEDPNELTDQTPLITGGVLDSIRTLKLVICLEDRFGITIDAHEAGVDYLDTIRRIAELVAQKRRPSDRVEESPQSSLMVPQSRSRLALPPNDHPGPATGRTSVMYV